MVEFNGICLNLVELANFGGIDKMIEYGGVF